MQGINLSDIKKFGKIVIATDILFLIVAKDVPWQILAENETSEEFDYLSLVNCACAYINGAHIVAFLCRNGDVNLTLKVDQICLMLSFYSRLCVIFLNIKDEWQFIIQ